MVSQPGGNGSITFSVRQPLQFHGSSQSRGFSISDPNVVSHAELLLTSFDQQTWRDLWEARLTAMDRPGVLARIADVLARLEVHILRARTITSGRCHVARLLIDCRCYASSLDGDSQMRLWRERQTLEELQYHLEAQMIDMVEFIGETPSIEIQRCRVLWNVYHDIMTRKRAIDDGFRLRKQGRSFYLPESRLDAVRRDLAVRNGVHPDTLTRPILLSSFDETAAACRLFITFEQLGAVALRVRLRGRDGIRDLTELLRSQQYNVLSSVVEEEERETLVWMLVHRAPAEAPARPRETRRAIESMVTGAGMRLDWQRGSAARAVQMAAGGAR